MNYLASPSIAGIAQFYPAWGIVLLIGVFHVTLFLPETLLLGMVRKKWTAQTEVTESLLKFREKRKWQLNYRRYVLEKMPCESYAPYFGLSTEMLRQWFELQFTETQTWDNFGKIWQFYHIVPTQHFDFSKEAELQLCWSYINIGIEPITKEADSTRMNLLAVRSYFQSLYNKTEFSLVYKMLDKLTRIETVYSMPPLTADFIHTHKSRFESILSFSPDEFLQLNQGMSAEDIVLEREILKRFG